jgi:hypothetical protein
MTAVILCAFALSSALGAPDSRIPDFAADNAAWNTDSTDFIALPDGPRPVSFDKAHPYVPNGIGQQPTYRIADLSNPILKPWAVERMRGANDEVLKGKAAFTAKSACWPGGVPAVLLRLHHHRIRQPGTPHLHEQNTFGASYAVMVWRIRRPLRRRRDGRRHDRAQRQILRR